MKAVRARWTGIALPCLFAAVAAAGCSHGGNVAGGGTGSAPIPSVSTGSGAPSQPVTSGAVPASASGSVSIDLSAVQQDIASSDSATSQVDTDIDAALAAQSQYDNG